MLIPAEVLSDDNPQILGRCVRMWSYRQYLICKDRLFSVDGFEHDMFLGGHLLSGTLFTCIAFFIH